MSDDNEPEAPGPAYGRPEVRRLIESVMKGRGWSAARLAREAGVAPSTITRALDPDGAFMPTLRTIQKIIPLVVQARIDSVDAILAASRDAGQALNKSGLIPYGGEIRPGHWVDIARERVNPRPVMIRDENLPEGDLIGMKIVGDAYEPEMPNGSWVIVQPNGPKGLPLYDGDIAVLRRRVDTTLESLIETTLWDVIVPEGGEIDAAPRGDTANRSPARPKGPIWRMKDVELVGVVVATYYLKPRNVARPAAPGSEAG